MPVPKSATALDAIWLSTGMASVPMRPLRKQLSDLAELVFEADQERGSSEWLGVAENLRIVTALEDISTGTPFGQPSQCSGVDDSDAGFNDMTRLRVAGMIAFTLTWQAYESAVYVHDPETKAAGARGRDLLKRSPRTARYLCLMNS